MFCCTFLYVHSSIAVALLNLSSWCLVMVEWFFLAVHRGCLQFVNVVFPDHTHLLFLYLKLCNAFSNVDADTQFEFLIKYLSENFGNTAYNDH